MMNYCWHFNLPQQYSGIYYRLKTQHMYQQICQNIIVELLDDMFRPNDGCFTAETCRLEV